MKKKRNSLNMELRRIVRSAVRWQSLDKRKWRELTGYDIEDLLVRLQGQFQPGMSWENYGEWHIDHIKPVAAFKYHKPDKAFRECWALDNLQPLWAKENRIKGCLYENMDVRLAGK